MNKKHFVLYLLPSRPDFAHTMTEVETSVMIQHVAYWTDKMKQGKVLAFGPVFDPVEVYGLGIIAVDNEAEVEDLISNDPAVKINRYEYFPMKAVVPSK